MRHLRPVVGFLLSGIALYFAFRGVEWRAVADGISSANRWLILSALPVLMLLFAARAQRWRLLFRPNRDVPLWSTFRALNIGYMASAVLPLQMGEVARAYALGESESIDKARVLSTIAVERVIDVLVLLAVAVCLVPFVHLPAPATYSLAVVVMLIAVAIAFIAVAVLDRARVEGWLEFGFDRAPQRFAARLRELSRSLLDGLSALASLRTLAVVLAWSVISWALSATVIYMLLRAFSLDVPLAAAPFLLVVTTLAFFIPSSPGAVGIYDAAAVRSLTSVFGVALGSASSYALTAHALYLVPPTVLGAIFFVQHHLTLRRIRDWSDGDAAAATVDDAAASVDDGAPAAAGASLPLRSRTDSP